MMRNNHNNGIIVIIMYGLIMKIILQLMFLGIWSMVAGAELQNIRGLSLPPPIPCNPGTLCVCPGNCLTYYNSTGGCHPNDCWKWDSVKAECITSGKEYIPALVLQAIPLTGYFGSGFGNMGRWDLFGMYMGVLFGGCCSIIMMGFCCLCCCNKNDDELEAANDKEAYMKCATNCGACIWGIVILVLYILGIVWTATPGSVVDADGCPLIF